jgi:TonB-linked SusC/RagA family outer membrane protein
MKAVFIKSGLLVTLLLFFVSAWSQTYKVTGTVLSKEDNTPMPSATITIKGKNTGTQTNNLGQFTIQAAKGETLVISSVGYATQEVKVSSSNPIEISLLSTATNLDEVVVVGYGTQQRKVLTGSVSTLNQLATKFTPSTNLGTALQGKIPGLMVQQNTGAPGSTPVITFRGGTDFSGSGSPLVVLDGVIVPSLYGIDMNDVESVDVLKDAASTAIYGARAANGVILVSTKKGKKGKTQVQYTVKQTTNNIRSIADQYLSAEDYIKMNRQGIRARYIADSLTGGAYAGDKGQLTSSWGWALAPGNSSAGGGLYTTQKLGPTNRQYLTDPNWKLLVDPNPFYPATMDSIIYKELTTKQREAMIMRSTPTTEHSLNFSGANDQGAFSLNLNTLKDNGTIIGSWLSRMNMNFNGSLNVNKRLKVSLNTSAYNLNQSVPYSEPGIAGVTGNSGGLLQRFLGVAPTVRYTNDTNGVILPGPNDVTLGNPMYWSTLYMNSTTEQRFAGSVNVEYTILPYLKLISNGSGFMRYGNNNYFTKAYIAGNGGALNSNRSASFSNYNDIQYTYNSFLQFNKEYKEHNITLLAGGEFYDYKRYVFSGFAQGAPTDIVPWLSASNTPSIINGVITNPAGASSSFNSWERIASGIARLNYSYKSKYFLTGVIRYDGSSRLSENNFYGAFPGVSAGWNLHNESFFQKSFLSKFVNTVKPRISYGVNGNLQYFGSNYYPTAQVYSNAGVYNGLGGVYASSYINTDLRWERSNSLNYGLDLGILNNRVTIIGDYFIRNVFDKLASLPISAQTGFTGFTTNLSQLQNRGVELNVNAKIIVPKNQDGLSLDMGATFYTVKNYAIKLPYNGLPGNRQGTFEVWDPNNPGQKIQVNGLIEGQRIGYDEVWAPKWAGIYTSAAMLATDAKVYNSYLPYGDKTFKQLGDAQWYQVYKNDTIDSRQFVYVGRTTPKGSGSFYLNAGFKGFHLYTAMDYAYGFVILNNEKMRGLSQVQGSQNGTKDILNTWTPSNPTATLPMFYWANQGRNFATDASGNNSPANMWEKGDYIMLREVSLSYELNKHTLSTYLKDKIKGLSFYVTGSNLAYITGYSGTFPEVGGIDNGRYPLPKRITLGAQLTF